MERYNLVTGGSYESWKEFLRLMADPNFLNAMTSADWLLGTKSEAEDEPSE